MGGWIHGQEFSTTVVFLPCFQFYLESLYFIILNIFTFFELKILWKWGLLEVLVIVENHLIITYIWTYIYLIQQKTCLLEPVLVTHLIILGRCLTMSSLIFQLASILLMIFFEKLFPTSLIFPNSLISFSLIS